MASDAANLTEAEFCARFVAEMMTYAPVYTGPAEDLRAYAEEIAPVYYAEEWQRANGPEECAASDVGYWEEG